MSKPKITDSGFWDFKTQRRPVVLTNQTETLLPENHRGICIWFTGLSGAGKTTTAETLTRIIESYQRPVTLLDGDVVRTLLSRGLGFSKEDRDVNIRRIGFVAAAIVEHGGIVICATVSPYRSTREEVREMMGPDQFVEIFVDTPLEICRQRDPKGLYARARRGEIRGLTGIDDPYEPPETPEIVLDTIALSPMENARLILEFIRGWLGRKNRPQ